MSGNYLLGISSFLIAMGVSWLVTLPVISLARVMGAMDMPGERKIHRSPIPRIGGAAVFLGFLGGLAFAAWATGNLLEAPRVGVYWRGLGLAAVGMFLLGLVDDLKQLSFRWKFAGQIAAALYVWWCGFAIQAVSNPFGGGTLNLGMLSLPITLLWVVGITNAVNLIDGLDGLAAGTAAIMAATVAAVALLRGDLGVTAVSVALTGSLLGFLWFNFNPAKIFLGDSGSMFLGFVLAVASIRGSHKGPTAVAILVPLLVLGLPIADTSLAITRRLYWLGVRGVAEKRGIGFFLRNLDRVFQADRSHIHHRLLDLGLGQKSAVMVLYGVVLVLAAASLSVVALNSIRVALALVGVLAALFLAFHVALYLREKRRRSSRGPAADVSPWPAASSSRAGSGSRKF